MFSIDRLSPRVVASWVMLSGTLLVGVAGPVNAATVPVKLTAEVGPGSNITLKNGSTRVVKLKQGSYVITVRDRATNHNFRLVGAGVNRATQVSRVETKTWTLTLRPGTYTYLCDPHKAFMRASFQVTR